MEIPETLEAMIEPVPESGCWLWTGGTDGRSGYGRVCLNGVTQSAHRIVYAFLVGPLGKGRVLRHKCDTPACVRPDHLVPGTPRQNARDMVERKRSAGGERSPNARLCCSDIESIKADTRAIREIADDYGISPSHVCRIRNGRRWISGKR